MVYTSSSMRRHVFSSALIWSGLQHSKHRLKHVPCSRHVSSFSLDLVRPGRPLQCQAGVQLRLDLVRRRMQSALGPGMSWLKSVSCCARRQGSPSTGSGRHARHWGASRQLVTQACMRRFKARAGLHQCLNLSRPARMGQIQASLHMHPPEGRPPCSCLVQVQCVAINWEASVHSCLLCVDHTHANMRCQTPKDSS